MSRKQKRNLKRIIAAAVLLIAAWVADALLQPGEWYFRLALYLPPYFVIGYDVLRKAGLNIIHGRLFDENFLMAVATVGAFGTGEYREAVAVMLFYQIGELFQGIAVGKSRKSIASLMDIRPDFANIERNGEIVRVDPDTISPGDTIIVKPGERVPLDGIVTEGSTQVDSSALTGESVPRILNTGDDIMSGCVNMSALVSIRVTKSFGESTVSKILDLVENASSKKAKTENFITRFSKVYTPVVVLSAFLLAVLPPLLLHADAAGWRDWIHRALTFLVISCPCALVISVPLSFFGGIGGASKCGILIKGGNYMEALSKTRVAVFDKTGTLKKGVFNVTALHPEKINESMLIEYAAYAETYSDHPIARSVKEAYDKQIDATRISNVEEIAGKGVKAEIDGMTVYVGNEKLMEQIGVDIRPCHRCIGGTIVHIAASGEYMGHLLISDELKDDAVKAIHGIKDMQIKTVMLTGDTQTVGETVAAQLQIDEYHCGLLPADKVEKIEEQLFCKPKNKTLLFIGDGINDAPVIGRADVGVAMGALGSDAAIEAADVVLMDDKPSKIVTAIKLARRTMRLVKENIVFSLSVKILVLILGAFGIADMWWAVFADVGVAVIAILNAMRALNVKNSEI